MLKIGLMTVKKFMLATFVGFVLSNVLTTLWYMGTDDANYVPYRREEINYGALMLNHLIYVLIFVHFTPFYLNGSKKLMRGFLFGCLMAALMFIPQALVVRSIWMVEINTIFVLNTCAHLLIGGIIGLSTTLIINYKNQNNEAI